MAAGRWIAPMLALVVLAGGCASGAGPKDASSQPLAIALSDIQIGAEATRALEDRAVSLQVRLEKTASGALALFPTGRIEGQSNVVRCVDLVADKRLKRRLKTKLGKTVRLEGRLVFVSDLGSFGLLSIDGVEHYASCQIFSKVSPYPYFLVTALD